MEKTKIVRIITRMNVGGPAIQAALLQGGLDERNFSSILITGPVTENEGDMSYLAAESGFKPLVIRELKRELDIVKDVICFFKLYGIIKKERPDIVHTHMAKAGTLGRLAAKFAGVPVIIHTYHGHVFHSYFSRFKTRAILLIERIMARFTDKIIVISRRQEADISSYLKLKDGSKLALIPLGLDLNRFMEGNKEEARDRVRRELRIPGEAIVVGTVGRLTAVKNHKMFLEAAGEIKKKFTDRGIKFLIVGDGELRGELTALSGLLGLYDDTIFTGWRKDMDSVYSAMDIVALTSLNEGTPVTLIEALANARPVIATDVGGVRDVAEDGKSGYIVPKDDVSAFAEAASALIEHKDKRDSFSLYGRNSVREKHSKGKLIKSIEELYLNESERKRRLSI